MRSSKLLLGLLIGTLFGLLFWYWQKSTSAEDGALDLLDRLAAAEKRVRELETQVQQAQQGHSSTPETADDLKQINGIGPVYEKRLNAEGINRFADLAQQTPERLREIVGLQSWHAADPQEWIDQAQSRL